MTKLSWPRAKAYEQRAKAARASATPWSPPARQPKDWAAVKRKRQINALTQRIESGKGWLSTIPTTDPRWPKWQRKLLELVAQRKSLGG